jgi:hypothetical protein
LPRLALNHDTPISASWVTESVCMHHWTQKFVYS